MDIENRVDIRNETKHRTNRGVLFRYGVQHGVRWIPTPHIPTLFLKIQRYSYTITTKYDFLVSSGYRWIGGCGKMDELMNGYKRLHPLYFKHHQVR